MRRVQLSRFLPPPGLLRQVSRDLTRVGMDEGDCAFQYPPRLDRRKIREDLFQSFTPAYGAGYAIERNAGTSDIVAVVARLDVLAGWHFYHRNLLCVLVYADAGLRIKTTGRRGGDHSGHSSYHSM